VVFLTLSGYGGRPRKTNPEDDQTLKETALANQWSGIGELRNLPEIENNDRIASVSDRTLRRCLNEKGINIGYIVKFTN